MTLNWLWPMTLVLLSIPLLKQKIKSRSIIAITISFFGVFIIATRGNLIGLKFTNPIGVVLALSSTIIWALFWIYNLKDKRDEIIKLFLYFFFGTLFITILILYISEITLPPLAGFIGSVYSGLFEMGIAFVMWIKALRLAKTTAKVSNLIFLSPFISLIFIRNIVGEEIMSSTIIGLILIISGIFLQKKFK